MTIRIRFSPLTLILFVIVGTISSCTLVRHFYFDVDAAGDSTERPVRCICPECGRISTLQWQGNYACLSCQARHDFTREPTAAELQVEDEKAAKSLTPSP